VVRTGTKMPRCQEDKAHPAKTGVATKQIIRSQLAAQQTAARKEEVPEELEEDQRLAEDQRLVVDLALVGLWKPVLECVME